MKSSMLQCLRVGDRVLEREFSAFIFYQNICIVASSSFVAEASLFRGLFYCCTKEEYPK